MGLVSIIFSPLSPGENPGDPELGGWRPLPKRFYTHKKLLAPSLGELVRLIAFRVHEFQVRQAIKIVAQRLAS